VFIGQAECNVTSSNITTLTCTVSRHSAGAYSVRVLIHETGFSHGEVCFTYLLTINSISPVEGSILGGYEVTITGTGFIELSTRNILDLPWINNGIGLPQIYSIDELFLCPSQKRQFEDSIGKFTQSEKGKLLTKSKINEKIRRSVLSSVLSNHSSNGSSLLNEEFCDLNIDGLMAFARNDPYHIPFSVYINDYPCLISYSSKHKIKCTITFAREGLSRVNITVFSQTAVLENSFRAALEHSPTITMLYPKFSSVIGGGVLTILGKNLTTSRSNITNQPIKIFIGRVPCKVMNASDTSINCMLGPHAPGHYRVWVLCPGGIAVLENNSSDLVEPTDIIEELNSKNWSINVSTFPLHEHMLAANVTSLVQSSVNGGSKVMIEGGIFVHGHTQVYIGGQLANIESLHENDMVVSTPSSEKTVNVDLSITILGKREEIIFIILFIIFFCRHSQSTTGLES